MAALLTLAVLLLPSFAPAQTAPPPTTAPPAAAAETNPTGWTAKAGLSFVQTSGNSETSTLGIKFNAAYNWERTYFTLVGSGVRSDTTFKDTFAVGTPESFDVVEVEDEQKTAENYALDASLDHNITDRFYWGGGVGWLRNTFAGVDNRYAARAGVGYIWTDPKSAGVQFRTGAFLTLTSQSLVVDDPTVDDTFVGVRALADLTVPIGKASTFVSRLGLDENLQETDDLRMTWWNSLGVNMTSRFAIQLSLLTYFDNLPALREISVFREVSGGLPIGPPLGQVVTPYGKWDNEFAVSLVINLAPKKPTPAPAGAK
jgi:putative salt-induced outer membrane protein YdiY